MATNLALDVNLINEAQSIGGAKTKKAAVTETLEEYIQRRKPVSRLGHNPMNAINQPQIAAIFVRGL